MGVTLLDKPAQTDFAPQPQPELVSDEMWATALSVIGRVYEPNPEVREREATFDPADVDTPRDPRTRQTLGQHTQEALASLLAHKAGVSKNRGHRTAPMRKRGDFAKRQRIVRANRRKSDLRVARAIFVEQLLEVKYLMEIPLHREPVLA